MTTTTPPNQSSSDEDTTVAAACSLKHGPRRTDLQLDCQHPAGTATLPTSSPTLRTDAASSVPPEEDRSDDDMCHVMLHEISRDLNFCGLVWRRRPTYALQQVTAEFCCPNRNTDPLHWTHGPEDRFCGRTDGCATYACTIEHSVHMIVNVLHGVHDPVHCQYGCSVVMVDNKRGTQLHCISASHSRGTDTSDCAVSPATTLNNPQSSEPQNSALPVPEPGVRGSASRASTSPPCPETVRSSKASQRSASTALLAKLPMADASNDLHYDALATAHALRSARRPSFRRLVNALPTFRSNELGKSRSRRATISYPLPAPRGQSLASQLSRHPRHNSI